MRVHSPASKEATMALIPVRRVWCEVGADCPALTLDTDTYDTELGTCGALVSGAVDPGAARDLGLPSHEGAIRLTAREVAELLHGLGREDFAGKPPQ